MFYGKNRFLGGGWALIKSEVKQKENCENQQEKQKNRNTNGNSHRNFSRF